MEEEIVECVAKLHPTPPPDSKAHRHTILSCLNSLAVYWIQEKAKELANSINGESYRYLLKRNYDEVKFVRPFGSYGLGILATHYDLDAVLLAPNFVSRPEFFSSFVNILSVQDGVQDICSLEGAFVPIVKFLWDKVEVNLTLAVLSTDHIPPDELMLSDDILYGMDEKSKTSLNGWRVCNYLLRYIPDKECFRLVLSFVKLWATKRQIYSNTLGYLGGISWAILVAFICRRNKGSPVANHLKDFFRVFASWPWPEPVNLNPWDNVLARLQRGGYLENYVMPIVTPCSPYQNSSFNVSLTNRERIVQELKRAALILDKQISSREKLDELVVARNPVEDYDQFLTIVAAAESDGLLKQWKGAVESRLRKLLTGEMQRSLGVSQLEIFPASYDVAKGLGSQQLIHAKGGVLLDMVVWVVGVSYKKGKENWRFADHIMKEFEQEIMSFASDSQKNHVWVGIRRLNGQESLGQLLTA